MIRCSGTILSKYDGKSIRQRNPAVANLLRTSSFEGQEGYGGQAEANGF